MRSNSRIVFRADASGSVGSGHLKRCMTIAMSLQKLGFSILFVGENSLEWLQKELLSLGFDHCRNYVCSRDDVLIIDSYDIDINQIEVMASNSTKILQIIDPESKIIEADLYIHPGPNFDFFKKSKYAHKSIYGGIDYLTTQNFMRTVQLSKIKKAKKVLVVGGGTDYGHFTKSLIPFLSIKQYENIEFHFMVKSINEFSRLGRNFFFHDIGPHIREIIRNVDTVISTAGTSSWDFIANSLVTGIALAVENQRFNYKFQTENDNALGVGEYAQSIGWQFNDLMLDKLFNDCEFRKGILKRNNEIFDLCGPERIASRILEFVSS